MLICYLVFGGDGEQLHGAALQRIVENFSVEVDIRLSLEPLLNIISQLQRLLEREGVSECKISRLVLRIGEHVRELESELLLAVEKVGDLGDDAPPLLLGGRHDPVDGLEPLVVQFGLQKCK